MGMLPLGLFVLFVAVGFFDDDSTVDLDTDGTDGDPAQDADGGVIDEVPVDADDDGNADGDEETVDDILEDLELSLETDPATGTITVTAAEDDPGSLALIRLEGEEQVGGTCCSTDVSYSGGLYYVPDGVTVTDVADAFDYNAFFANAADGQEPTLDDIYGSSGMELLAEFDMGRYQYLDGEQGVGSATQLTVENTLTNMPEVLSNLPIEYYGSQYEAAGEREVVDFDQPVEMRLATEGLTEDEVLNQAGLGREVDPQDGDIIDGTDFPYLILNPPGDPTAVTIQAGAGEDTITAGLNDTIVTNDDTDTDTILIGKPLSFADIYSEVPILEAGAEDIVEVDGDGNFVIRFEQDAGNGVTDVFYHVLTSDAALVPPPSSVEAGEALSLKDFYARSGWQLLAVGGLGNVTIDGAATSDNTIPPPSFSGLDTAFFNQSNGLFSMKLGADGAVTNQTMLTSGWPALT